MTPGFLRAVVDTLLPGEGKLPQGSAAGVKIIMDEPNRAVLDAIAEAAGSAASFVAADEAGRSAALRAAEQARPEAFRALVTPLLCDYYESGAVLAALGWPVEPPQPAGHAVPPDGPEIRDGLERMRRRDPLWRR